MSNQTNSPEEARRKENYISKQRDVHQLYSLNQYPEGIIKLNHNEEVIFMSEQQVKPAAMNEIPKELTGLAKACEALLNATHNLMDKVTPAMGPSRPNTDTQGPANPQPIRSDLACIISARKDQVQDATRIINDVVDRLEL